MLLMGACLSVFGLAVCCLAFGAATRDSGNTAAAAPAVEKEMVRAAVSPARFFVDPPVLPAHQLFGDKLIPLIEELNQRLAA
jgi:hypothetical protein